MVSEGKHRRVEIRANLYEYIADLRFIHATNTPLCQRFLELLRGQQQVPNGSWDVSWNSLCVDKHSGDG